MLPEVDLALCLIDAAQAGKRTEMEFIRHVATQAPLTRVLVHKIDRVEQSEREDLLDALMNTLQTFWPKDRGPVPEPWMASSLSVLDPIFGSKNPQLAAAFGHLREDLVGIAEEHRSQRILARNGSWDREHLDAAIEAEKAENLSEAHEQYIDLQTLYQELDCPVPVDVLEGIERVESQMMSATAQINEAHVLVDRVAALVLREEQPTEMTKDLIRQAGAIFYKANLRDMVFEKLGRQVLGNEVTKFLPEQTKDLDTISIPPQSERENSPSLDWFDRAEDPFHTLSFGVAHCRATASKMSRDFKVPRPWIKNDWETISCATNLALATESLNEFWGEQQNELQSEMIENLGTVINQLLESLMLTTAKNTSGSKFLFTLTQHEFAKIATVIEFMANENNNDTFSQISNSIIQYNNKCFLSIMDISKNNNKLIKFIELINEKEWDNKTINETAGDISFLGGEENSFEWLQDASYMELEPWSAFNSRSLESAARLAVLSEYLSDSTNIPDNRDISEDAKQLRTIADNIMVSQIKATANNTNGAMVDMVETQDHFSRLATEFENLSNNYTSVNFTAASNTITEINNALFDSLAECAKNNAFLANYLNEYHSNKSDGTNKTEPSNNNADPNKLYKCNSCGIMTYSPVIRSNCMTCPTCGRSY